jgi:hypothetical protein
VTFARTMSELWLSERTSFFCCQPSIAATMQAACSFMSSLVISQSSCLSTRLRTRERCARDTTVLCRVFISVCFRGSLTGSPASATLRRGLAPGCVGKRKEICNSVDACLDGAVAQRSTWPMPRLPSLMHAMRDGDWTSAPSTICTR